MHPTLDFFIRIRGSGGRRTMVRRGVPLSSVERGQPLGGGLLIGQSRVPRALPGRHRPSRRDVDDSAVGSLDLGDRPAEAREFAGGGHRDDRSALVAGFEPGPGAVQPALRCPGDRDRLGWLAVLALGQCLAEARARGGSARRPRPAAGGRAPDPVFVIDPSRRLLAGRVLATGPARCSSSAARRGRTAQSRRSRRTARPRSACRSRAGTAAGRPAPATASSGASRRSRAPAGRGGAPARRSRRAQSSSVVCAAGHPSSIVASHARWRSVHASPSSNRIPWRNSSFESRCRQRIRSTRTASRARTRSRSASSSGPGTRTGCSLPGQQQPHQMLGVTAIGLHPIPRRARDLRRRRDHALHPALRELAREPVPGRAGLIRDPHRPRQPGAEPRRLADLAAHRETLQLARSRRPAPPRRSSSRARPDRRGS